MTSSPLQRPWSLGVRTQLTLWYTAVFAALILLFSVILYTTLQASLTSGVDAELQLRTQQIAAGISDESGEITIQDVTGELPEPGATTTIGEQNVALRSRVQSDVSLGVLVRVLNTKGQIIYISPAFRALTVPSVSITQPLGGVPWEGTVLAHKEQAVRLYSVALTEDDGTVFGILQVGKSLAELTAALRSIVIALLLITPFVLLLSAFGSYWLAKRAFRPIRLLTRTARDIKARDLRQRVPIPQAKDEVQALAMTLNEMIERLDRAFTQQRRFVADASHELRTPVAALRTITEVALAQPLNLAEHVAVLGNIHAETERLSQLINDLLILARADEEQTRFDCEPVQLDLLVLDIVASIEPLAIERGLTVQVEKLEPVTIKGDTARLILALMGLVDNALTYTNAGGRVTLSVEVIGTSTRFSVRDTGIGIAPEDVTHIFERFYRADPARSQVAGGSGLGLAIVDWVVRAHGGSVAVESQIGRGSTFTVTLPLYVPDSAEADCLTSGQLKVATIDEFR